MRLDSENVYNEFVLSKGFQGRRNKINKKKFIEITNTLNDHDFITSFSTKEEAKKALTERASGSLGIIGFWILKTVVYWIIDKILEHYFG